MTRVGAVTGLDGPWEALGREHLAAGRRLIARVRGHSMWPLIRDGQTVEIEPPPGDLRVGDVVLVARRGLVLHRLVAMTPTGLVTKGDAVGWDDGETSREDLVGWLPAGRPGGLCAVLGLPRLIAMVSRRGGEPLAAVMRRLRVAVSRRP